MKHALFLWILVGLAAPSGPVHAQVTNAFPHLTFNRVVDIQAPPDGTDRLFVLEKRGVIRVFKNDASATETAAFLDMSERVDDNSEGGLLGLAFHPAFEKNRTFFIYYTTSSNGPFRSVLSRMQVREDDPNKAREAPEDILFEIPQTAGNHNGGQLHFGPEDGYLYISFGDGGTGQGGKAQDLTNPFGSILRIDVDRTDGDKKYAIPEDNPFAGNEEGFSEEIYAFGLRNPWRFSFGPEGRMWVADVGEGEREEIDWVVKGGNYGWNVLEGNRCNTGGQGCASTNLIRPIWEYNHDAAGGRSITGGYVYTGTDDACAGLAGRYIYGDYDNGNMWALRYDKEGVVENVAFDNSGLKISTFGVDRNGVVYVADYRQSGALYRIDCEALDPPLPVELAAFEAVVDGKDIVLGWETASETNNAGFEVQWKRIGSDYATVAFVEGAGTTAGGHTYGYRMTGLEPGEHFFRLKQIDFDGSTHVSRDLGATVDLAGTYHLSAVHPNPFNPRADFSLMVRETQPVRIALYDMLGRQVALIFEGVLEADRQSGFVVPGDRLSSGAYLLRVDGQTFQESRQITLLK